MQLAKVKVDTEELLELRLNQQITDFKLMKIKLVNKELELNERRMVLEKADSKTIDQIAEIGKLLKKPSRDYRMASKEKKRFLVKSLLENFSWSEEKLIPNWIKALKLIAKRPKLEIGRSTENRTQSIPHLWSGYSDLNRD